MILGSYHTEAAPLRKMARLLDLPLEVRNMIYHKVARGAKVKFVAPGEKLQLSTCGALLVCCKQVSTEFLPIFHEDVRINFSTKIDKTLGTILLPSIQLDAIRHVKLSSIVFATNGGMLALRRMSNLKSFTFPVPGGFDIPEYIFECMSGPICDCSDSSLYDEWGECGYPECPNCDEKYALGELQDQINRRKGLLVGQCACNNDRDGYDYDPYECMCSDNPIRKVIGVWEYLNKPFKLTAEAAICDETGCIGDCVSAPSPSAYRVALLTLRRLDSLT
jgi:hypothetical protein